MLSAPAFLAAPAFADQHQVDLGGLLTFAKQGVSQVTSGPGFQYQPSLIDTTTTYYCGMKGAGDTIFMVGDPNPVVDRSTDPVANDYGFACAPSAVVVPKWNQFALYYECSNHAPVNQICVAFSTNGVTFSKYLGGSYPLPPTDPNQNLNPYPVIPAGTQIQYGSGHPSAVVYPNGNLTASSPTPVYLFYYAQNDGQSVGMWFKVTCDGVNFSDPACTKMTTPTYTGVGAAMQVKYYYGPGAPSAGMFIGVVVYQGRTYFNYSLDGIHWDWNDPTTLTDGGNHYIGYSGISNQCVSPGTPSLGADGHGQINTSTGAVLLSQGEGQLGGTINPPVGDMQYYSAHPECHSALEESPSYRGYTWNLYEISGNFTFTPAPPPPPPPSSPPLSGTTFTSGTYTYTTTQPLTDSGTTINGSASVAVTAGSGGYIKLEPQFQATAGSAGVTFHAIAGP
jgi:hypothetical protein